MMAFIPLHKGTKKPALAHWNQRENCVIEFENNTGCKALP